MKYEWNNEQSETRRMGENNIHAERSEAENFFEKIYNKGPKIHCLAGQEGFLLKSAKRCIRDSPYLGRGGGHGPLGPPLDPLLIVNLTLPAELMRHCLKV